MACANHLLPKQLPVSCVQVYFKVMNSYPHGKLGVLLFFGKALVVAYVWELAQIQYVSGKGLIMS